MKHLLSLLLLLPAGLLAQGGFARQIDLLTELADDVQPMSVHRAVFVKGYHFPGDGGGGWFFPTNTITATNLGTRIDSSYAGWSWDRLTETNEFNVKWFGAKGDGTTDDATALQAAIDAAEAAGGTVYFPAGTYRITADLELGANELRLVGEGRKSIISQATAGQSAIANVTGTRLYRITIKDLKFTTAAGVNAAIAIDFSHVSDSFIENVYVTRDGGAGSGYNKGIYIGSTSAVGGAFRNTIQNCVVITSDTAADRYAVHLNGDVNYGGNSTRIIGGEFRGETSIGIYIDEGDQVTISQAVFEGSQSPAVYIDGNESTILGCRFENTTGAGVGITLDAAYATILGNLFSPSLTTFVNNTGSTAFPQNIRELRASSTQFDADTTPDVTGLSYIDVNPTTTVSITGFDGGYRGQTLTVFNRDHNVTFVNGANLKLFNDQNYRPPTRSATVFHCDGTIWYQVTGENNTGEFNVLEFGAEGDGTTDDTTAIQAAIDAAEAAGGGVVLFPKGTYAITSSISIKSGVTLSGDGKATILATADFTGSTYMLAVANTATDAGVEGITIDGDNRANKAFDFGDGGSDLFLRRCTIIDVASKVGETVGTWAIDVGGNSRVTIEDVRIANVNGTAGSGAQAIGIGGGNSNTAGLVIRGCDISGVVTGGVDADAINVFSSGSTTDTETRIESCRFADCDWRFIKVFGERVVIANNQGLLDSTPPQAHDSCIAVFASDVTVTGNDFRTSGGTTNYYVAGIETADASGFSPSRLVLSNNRISNSLSSGYASGDAAVVLKSQASTDEAISVTGNVFSGFPIGVKIQGTATLDGVVINGNVFRNLTGRCLDISLRPNASYTATFAASGNTITDAGATFITDGFQVGGKVRITGTSSNNATRTITSLSETVITVDSGIADEGPLSATLQGVSVLKGFVVTSNAFESSTTSSAVNLNGADLQGSVIMANVWDVSGSANALNNLITGQYAVGPNMLRVSGADYPVGGPHDRPVTEASVTGAKTVTVGHRRSALVFADSGAANVTNFTEGFQGQTVTLFFTNGNTTITHGSTIKLNGGVDFVGSADDTLTLRNLSGIWYEVSRSVN